MNAVIEHFHFLRPLWLLAALPAVWLFFLSWKNRNQASEWQSEIAPHLLPWLVDGSHSTGSKLPWYILLLLWLVAAIALAGPTWEKLPQPLMKDSSALVVLFDLSPSMNVKDVAPSRVVRARLKLIDLLDTRKEGLTALVAYAGEAHVVTPLTDDVETIKNLVPSLAPQTMPVPGSNAEMAMEMANRLLKDAGIAHGNILFITDGIAPAAFTELKKLQTADGHKVSVWGFGTRAGAPIQLPDGGFARSKSGEIVVAKLEDEELSDAAIAMGGIYVPFTDTTEDIDTVRNFSSNPFNKQQRAVEREFDQWVEFGPWLVLLCLPLVALSFRRGLVLSLLLATSLQHLPEANAQGVEGSVNKPGQIASGEKNQQQTTTETGLWDDLWLTRNQRAQRALEAGNPERAAELFEQPQRKGAANFRANNFEEAAEFFKQTENTAESWFNQGTALTHAGKYDQALAAYNKALELQPEFPEASNNLDITKKLRELEKQQQQNNQNQNQQDQNQQNQQGQNQQNDQQQQGQQQGEQEHNPEQQNTQNDENQQNSQKQDDAQENGKQTDDEQQDAQQQAQQNAESEVDEERAQQDFEKQLAEAQKQQAQQQDQPQTPEQKAQQAEELTEDERQAEQEQQEAYIDPDQLAASEDQQKLEQLLRRVPDDPGRLLRNKFRYEAQQRRTEVDPGKWNTLENAEEERW